MWESRAFVYLHFRAHWDERLPARIYPADGGEKGKKEPVTKALTSSFSPGRQRQPRTRVHPPGYRSSGTAGKSSTIIHRPRNTVLSSPTFSLIHSKNTCSLSEFSEQSCQPCDERRRSGGGEFEFDPRRFAEEFFSNSAQLTFSNLEYTE